MADYFSIKYQPFLGHSSLEIWLSKHENCEIARLSKGSVSEELDAAFKQRHLTRFDTSELKQRFPKHMTKVSKSIWNN